MAVDTLGGVVQAFAVDVVTLARRVPEMHARRHWRSAVTLALRLPERRGASLRCGRGDTGARLAREAGAATLALAGVVQALAVDVVTLAPRVPEMRTLARDAGSATLALRGVVQALAVDVVTLALG